ncbi:hypothetical protein LJC74_09830, partial [Eubacteriales bacterium OttesenSCG-928-A19]|nr:hypothetical protein [Eubacteriales bacterium OttesenSCG-928-A19]
GGAYLLASDKKLFKRMPKRDWILVDFPSHCIRFEEGTLDYMAPGWFGPVEVAGGTKPSGYYAVGIRREGSRTNMLLPWQLGRLYEAFGFEEHRDILLDLLDSIGCGPVETDAPDMVELFYDGCPGGRLIQMVNLSGFNGTSVHKPIPMRDIHIAVPAGGATRAVNLRTDEPIACTVEGGMLRMTLPALENYAAILIPEA